MPRRAPPATVALIGLCAVVSTVAHGRTRAAEQRLEPALADFRDARREHPNARVEASVVASADPNLRRHLAGLTATDASAAPEGSEELTRTVIAIIDAGAALPFRQDGYRPSAPTLRGAALSVWTHTSLLALLTNLLALALIGASLERARGAMSVAAVFALAHLGGLAAHHWLYPEGSVPLLGASAAVYGLLGARLAESPRIPWLGPVPIWPIAGAALLWESAAAIMGWTPSISHAAHIGGFSVGATMGLALRRVTPRRVARPRSVGQPPRGPDEHV